MLAKYITEDAFLKLKDQMESKNKITLPSTKEFFEVESQLTAMDFCLKQLQEIHRQKEYQIYCEIVHVNYNK